MLQNCSEINVVSFCFLLLSIFAVPKLIMCSTSHRLQIFKIRNLFKQNLHISCLIQIQTSRYKWPECMIHPDTCNIVSVCNKLTLLISDDCRICSINSYSAIIIHDHLTDVWGIHNQKCKAILPEISPASSSFSIIVIWKEGTSINSS